MGGNGKMKVKLMERERLIESVTRAAQKAIEKYRRWNENVEEK